MGRPAGQPHRTNVPLMRGPVPPPPSPPAFRPRTGNASKAISEVSQRALLDGPVHAQTHAHIRTRVRCPPPLQPPSISALRTGCSTPASAASFYPTGDPATDPQPEEFLLDVHLFINSWIAAVKRRQALEEKKTSKPKKGKRTSPESPETKPVTAVTPVAAVTPVSGSY